MRGAGRRSARPGAPPAPRSRVRWRGWPARRAAAPARSPEVWRGWPARRVAAPARSPEVSCAMQTAVVTGAGRGLGRLIAHGLADKGLFVLVTDVDIAAARDTAAAIGGERAEA